MKKTIGNIGKDEKGYIVVETVGTFIPFTLLVISILSLVNIVTLQARVHNALTQTANTLSMYSYVLYATGKSDGLKTADNKANASRENINSVISGIESLSKGNGFDRGGGRQVLNTAQSAVSDPKAALEGLLNFGAGELRSRVSAQFAEPFMGRYLANGEMSADEYLSSVRVKNFDLTQCVIIDRNENILLTVEYEIEYTFGALRLPFGPVLKVTQSAVTKAWLGGSGEGYW
ncbi:MAG: hypothetical protein FWD38_05100 [Oscillospiraceae bacterium]|nr:hypothetical protein [Oscillospiraceae bacterium]